MVRWILAGLIAVFVILLAPVVWVLVNPTPPPPVLDGLPWQVERSADGRTSVFGVAPGHSTLDELVAKFGSDHQLAVMQPAESESALEAYFPDVRVGFVTGKLVARIASSEAEREAWAKASPKARYTDSGARQYPLTSEDAAQARRNTIQALSFLPSARLDVDTLLARFGPPVTRLTHDGVEYFLYPDRGLTIALDNTGHAVFEYVAPTDFARLTAPLLQNALTPPPATTTEPDHAADQ